MTTIHSHWDRLPFDVQRAILDRRIAMLADEAAAVMNEELCFTVFSCSWQYGLEGYCEHEVVWLDEVPLEKSIYMWCPLPILVCSDCYSEWGYSARERLDSMRNEAYRRYVMNIWPGMSFERKVLEVSGKYATCKSSS
jgi:hypothetical protein